MHVYTSGSDVSRYGTGTRYMVPVVPVPGTSRYQGTGTILCIMIINDFKLPASSFHVNNNDKKYDEMGNAESSDNHKFDGCETLGYRILGVQPDSPASRAGLVSFFDFLVLVAFI